MGCWLDSLLRSVVVVGPGRAVGKPAATSLELVPLVPRSDSRLFRSIGYGEWLINDCSDLGKTAEAESQDRDPAIVKGTSPVETESFRTASPAFAEAGYRKLEHCGNSTEQPSCFWMKISPRL